MTEKERRPQQPSPIAVAMAQREAREAQLDSAFVAMVRGNKIMPPPPSPFQLHKIALTIDVVLSDTSDPQLEQALIGDRQRDLTGRLVGGMRTAIPEAGGIIDSAGELLTDDMMAFSEGTTGEAADSIRRTAKAALRIADVRGIHVEDVLLNEELYEEVIRSAFRPAEIVAQYVHTPEAETAAKVARLQADLTRTVLDAQITDAVGEGPAEQERAVREAADLAMLELTAGDEFGAQVDYVTNELERLQFARAAYEVRRFWGEDGFQVLPPQLQRTLREHDIGAELDSN